MTTMKVTNAQAAEQRLKAMASFGEFFAGTLYQIYGGIFARPTEFNPDCLAAQEAAAAGGCSGSAHLPTPRDGVELRLTRYQGGSKGPVILSHGLGVSSLIFSTDTIETNLLEYLFAHGYDVWLLDFRASIALPAATAPANGDDHGDQGLSRGSRESARTDRRAYVQMVVHCWGQPLSSWRCWPGYRACVRQCARRSPPTSWRPSRRGSRPDCTSRVPERARDRSR